jgi:hypothetical protein
METFVLVMFWIEVVAFILGLIVMSTKTFPYNRKETIGSATAKLILTAGFVFWAGFLLWG